LRPTRQDGGEGNEGTRGPDMEVDSDEPEYTPPRNPTGGFNHPFGGPGGMAGMAGMGGMGGMGGGGAHDFLPADVNTEEARMLEAVMMGVPYTGHIPDFEAQAAVRFVAFAMQAGR
jgi:hypothetical protein